jgi:polyhydroxybutyrate depolymerase
MLPGMRAPSLAFSLLMVASVAAALAACGPSSSPATGTTDGGAASSGGTSGGAGGEDGGDPTVIGGDRPVTVHVPASYIPGTAAPLVIVLHGYAVSGALQDLYFGMTAVSDARGFLYAFPDGTVDSDGKRFWNATDACCDLHATKVDDSTYVSSLITQIQARYTVDPKRIFLVGHSNGAFMSYRMACDHADQIAAIASLAGAMFSDVSKCAPSQPVSVLQIHGTADDTVLFDGDQIAGQGYPGAKTTISAPERSLHFSPVRMTTVICVGSRHETTTANKTTTPNERAVWRRRSFTSKNVSRLRMREEEVDDAGTERRRQ